MQNQDWQFLNRCIVVGAVAVLATVASAQSGRTPGAKQQGVHTYQAPSTDTVVQAGTVITPASSVQRPEDAGKFAHTNYKLFHPAGREMKSISPDNTFAEYPASLACVYKVGPAYAGCQPLNNGKVATGGWGAIALVDAYDLPTASTDIAYFSSYFGLPAANFGVVWANSSWGAQGSLGLVASCSGQPANGNAYGWSLESALDIEWAHAMAPSATILLVEACSNSYNDLFVAEEVASYYVSLYGGGEVSNSWGSGEFASEVNFDNYFYRDYYDHITRFVSAGDSGLGAAYPSSSPWVVSAGGTRVNRSATGNFQNESCWSGSGGGTSSVEIWQNPPNHILNGMGAWSAYQYKLFGGYPFSTAGRATPDLSFDADPASGVWVRDTDDGTWFIVGGTSVSSPALAGIVNASNNRLGQTPPGGGWYHNGENDLLYAQLYTNSTTSDYKKNFYDVKTGSNGAAAGPGWDYCTGVGSPRGKAGK
jgi:subtilase family serine protease